VAVEVDRSIEIEVLGKCNRVDGNAFWRRRDPGINPPVYPVSILFRI
jgi:hypothetical protein